MSNVPRQIQEGSNFTRKMSLDQFKKTLDQIVPFGNPRINLEGDQLWLKTYLYILKN